MLQQTLSIWKIISNCFGLNKAPDDPAPTHDGHERLNEGGLPYTEGIASKRISDMRMPLG
jgi:hypothetical protein